MACEAREFNIVSSPMTLHCVYGETKVSECSSANPKISSLAMLLITSSRSRQVTMELSAHLPKVLEPWTNK